MTLFLWPQETINTAGISTEAKQDATIAELVTIDGHVDGLETLATATNTKLDTLNAKDFATETTLAKTRKWPYANFNAQVYTSGASTDTWEYKTGGIAGTTVGTILITYADSTKEVITLVAYTPQKVV